MPDKHDDDRPKADDDAPKPKPSARAKVEPGALVTLKGGHADGVPATFREAVGRVVAIDDGQAYVTWPTLRTELTHAVADLEPQP